MREGRDPENVPFLLFLCLSAMRWLVFSFVLSWFFPWSFPLLGRRRPDFDWQQSVVEETWYLEKPHRRCSGIGGAAPMALRAAVAG